MFYRYEDLQPEALLEERYERAKAIAEELPNSEIRDIERREVRLYLPDSGEVIAGDVSRNGFTVYLGGFDWVTFPTPGHVLSKFPEFMPLPQQTYTAEDAI